MSQTTDAFDPAARWAAPSGEPLVTDDLRALLRQAFALEDGAGPAASPAAVALAVGPSLLPGAALEALEAGGGAAPVVRDASGRAPHANGMSSLALVRRSAAPPVAPDAVVEPADHAEVAAVLRACTEHGVAVVPFG